MQINNISIRNFRNYDNLELDFNSRINIFIGDNAQGKTNLLESIYVLAITKSHRIFIDNNLIKNKEIYTKIKGTIISNNTKKNLEILINSKGKSVKINNNIIKKISDYISNFNVIIFYPDDLELIKGNPSVRRKFLNIEISQLNNKYLSILNEYNLILKDRNNYLKDIRIENVDKTYIDILNNKLVEKGLYIFKLRKEFLDDISIKISSIYENIYGKKDIKIKYNSNIDFDNYNEKDIKLKYLEKLNNNLKREILQGTTLYGPHRDDFSFIIEEEEIKEYGSQGQHRLAVLCIKLAELEIFKEKKGEYPILLLDDVFSELDEKKKNNIIKYIGKDIQTFITTTDIKNINEQLLNDSTIFEILDGNILNKTTK